MFNIVQTRLATSLVFVTTTFSSCLMLHAAVPAGWLLAGSKPTEYESGVDTDLRYDSRASAYLKSRGAVADGFGTLMQEFRATKYVKKRVRFTAWIKTQDAQERAGLWMRVDKDSKPVAFDNMRDRPIKGTTEWQRYAVVLDVPADATRIAFGVLLSGSGAVWISGARFEEVGPETPTTGAKSQELLDREGPVNLDFSEP